MSVFVIIVTYNPEHDLLRRQYESIRGQVSGIIYVDNHSTSLALPLALPEEDGIYYILNNRNEGLGYAQNQGIKKALELGADFILLLDQDSELFPSMIQDLKDTYLFCLSKGEKVGAVAPGIVNAFDESSPVLGILIDGIHIKTLALKDIPLEVSYCIASGTLIHKSVLEDIGLMNEYMFIDFLDLEWCMRARSKDYKIFLSPKARLLHRLGNGEMDRITSHSPMREYYICRNGFLLLKLNYIPLGFKIRRCVLIPLRVLKSFVTGRKEYFKNGLKGVYDAFLEII
ncbi:glycosyltransferase family 2 protein [uncultured Parabacteroides sp.]|uniref:glycosyltransferase family 2 protein n=1 Tax=uncultured Parabacteroides sp. TaxID=512312 RepID=UPI002639E94A|nr:glycosyltransferase family 2 protein [uncultured Parabacteroides sp.]